MNKRQALEIGYFVRGANLYYYRFLLFLLFISSGCTYVSNQVEDAGNFLARQVGFVSDESKYSKDQQRQNALELITPEQEYYIGRAVAARILQRFPSTSNHELQRYVELTGNALLVNDGAGAPFGGYHFHVVESEQLNAISAPGGYIFITSGFLKSLKSEDQLAAILAHEVTHIKEKHGLKTLQNDSLLAEISVLGLAAGGLSCVEALAQATVIFSHLVDGLIDTLLESGYSHEFEYQADQGSYERLFNNGYQPQAIFSALYVIQQTEETGKNGSSGWFSTHPSVAERIAKLNSQQPLGSADSGVFGVEKRNKRWLRFVKGS
jgi:beta-barrel assembly-enhancing protease